MCLSNTQWRFYLETFAHTCSFFLDRSPYLIPLPTRPLATACAVCTLLAWTPLPLDACPAHLTKPSPSIQTRPCPSRTLCTLAHCALGALLLHQHGSSRRAGSLPVCPVHCLSPRTVPGAHTEGLIEGSIYSLSWVRTLCV